MRRVADARLTNWSLPGRTISCGRPELAGRLRRLFRVHGLRYWQMLDISSLATRKELVELARGFSDI
jgi:hypothetical protein